MKATINFVILFLSFTSSIYSVDKQSDSKLANEKSTFEEVTIKLNNKSGWALYFYIINPDGTYTQDNPLSSPECVLRKIDGRFQSISISSYSKESTNNRGELNYTPSGKKETEILNIIYDKDHDVFILKNEKGYALAQDIIGL